MRAVGQRKQLLQVVPIEIGDTPVANPAGRSQLLETSDRLGESDVPAPMQQIQIEVIGLEPGEASLAGGNDTALAGVVRIDLAY